MISITPVIQRVNLKLLLSTNQRRRQKLYLTSLLQLEAGAEGTVEEGILLLLIEVDEEVMQQEVEGLLHLNS